MRGRVPDAVGPCRRRRLRAGPGPGPGPGPGQGNPGGGGGSDLCGLAWWLFLALLLAGTITLVAGACTDTLPAIITGVALLVAAGVVLGLWLCGAANCDPLLDLIWILTLLTALDAIAALIFRFVGDPGCETASWAGAGHTGVLLGIVVAVAQALGCLVPRRRAGAARARAKPDDRDSNGPCSGCLDR